MCLPVIAPPQVRGRELLIAGSLIGNPVGVMAELGEGGIIAVDVKTSFERPDTAGQRRATAPHGRLPPIARLASARSVSREAAVR